MKGRKANCTLDNKGRKITILGEIMQGFSPVRLHDGLPKKGEIGSDPLSAQSGCLLRSDKLLTTPTISFGDHISSSFTVVLEVHMVGL